MSAVEEIILHQKIEAYGEGMVFKPQEDDFGVIALCPEKKFYLRDLNTKGKIRWLPYHHFPVNYPALYDFENIHPENAQLFWKLQKGLGGNLHWVCPEISLKVPEEVWGELKFKGEKSPLSVLLTGSPMGQPTTLYGIYHDKNRYFENTILKTYEISVDLWRKLEDSDSREDIIPEFPDPPIGLIVGHNILTVALLDILKVYNNPVSLSFALTGR